MSPGLLLDAIASAIAPGCGTLVCGEGERSLMRSDIVRSDMAERGGPDGDA